MRTQRWTYGFGTVLLVAACATSDAELEGQPGDPNAPDDVGVTSQSIVADCSEASIRREAPADAQGMMDRAFDWIHRRVMYCQCVTGAGGPYRTDCSGFVSMVWGLRAPGHVTHSFAGGQWADDASFRIAYSQLQVGDALNWPGNPAEHTGHVVLFGGWLNAAHTRFCSLEESHTGTPARVIVRNVDGAYIPIRLAGRHPEPAQSCVAHCEGAVAIGRDCGRTDCGGSGAVCVQGGGGPSCAQPGRGAFDAAACDVMSGWAQDPNTADQPVQVDLYIDGPPGGDTRRIRVAADQARQDLCSAIGSCAHGFGVQTPDDLRDGRPHTVQAVMVPNTGGLPSAPLSGSPRTLRCARPMAGDFDGDGRSDLVQFRGDLPGVPVCLSTGTGWSCRHLSAAGPGGDGTVASNALGLLSNLDGDARVDLLQFDPSLSAVPLCTSLGSGWSCDTRDATFAGGDFGAGVNGSGLFTGGTPLVGDFDGDHRSDLVQYSGAWQSLVLCLSLGTGFSCRNLRANFAGGDGAAGNGGAGVYPGGTPLVGDFDGDGRADVIQFNPTWNTIPVCLSLGTGFSCRNLRANFAGGDGAAGNDGSAVYPDATPLVGDFNGDGRADVMQFNAGWNTIPVCLSTGSGWSCRNLRAHYTDGDEPAGNAGAAVYPGARPVLTDFNGDGRVDLVQYRDDARTLPVCLSLGTGWSCRNLRANFTGGDGAAGNDGSGVYPFATPVTGDFNGDGRSDLAQFVHRASNEEIPVCLSLASGWSCRSLRAAYVGGQGAGHGGSGVY
jgi:hypothetical protein